MDDNLGPGNDDDLVPPDEMEDGDLTGPDDGDGPAGEDRQRRIRGRGGNDRLRGGRGDDRLHGNKGNDDLMGGDGDDLLRGGNGRDRLKGGMGNDRLYGENGNDMLTGNEGDDLLDGGNGNDRLEGGSGNDSLMGGNGRDMLVGADALSMDGAPQVDTLTGGRGQDMFMLGALGLPGQPPRVFYSMGGAEDYAVITDFSRQDKIMLAGSRNDYSLGSAPQGAGVGIYLGDETSGDLIAVVQGAAASRLQLNSRSFVDGGRERPR